MGQIPQKWRGLTNLHSYRKPFFKQTISALSVLWRCKYVGYIISYLNMRRTQMLLDVKHKLLVKSFVILVKSGLNIAQYFL